MQTKLNFLFKAEINSSEIRNCDLSFWMKSSYILFLKSEQKCFSRDKDFSPEPTRAKILYIIA